MGCGAGSSGRYDIPHSTLTPIILQNTGSATIFTSSSLARLALFDCVCGSATTSSRTVLHKKHHRSFRYAAVSRNQRLYFLCFNEKEDLGPAGRRRVPEPAIVFFYAFRKGRPVASGWTPHNRSREMESLREPAYSRLPPPSAKPPTSNAAGSKPQHFRCRPAGAKGRSSSSGVGKG